MENAHNPEPSQQLQLVRAPRGAAVRLGRLEDRRVGTAPPGGGWDPRTEDMCSGTEISAASNTSLQYQGPAR